MTAIEMTEKVQDGVLKAIETSQGWTLGALRSDLLGLRHPEARPPAVPFADGCPPRPRPSKPPSASGASCSDAQHSFVSGITEIDAAPAGTAATKKS